MENARQSLAAVQDIKRNKSSYCSDREYIKSLCSQIDKLLKARSKANEIIDALNGGKQRGVFRERYMLGEQFKTIDEHLSLYGWKKSSREMHNDVLEKLERKRKG